MGNLHDAIMNMPNQWNTLVEEHGLRSCQVCESECTIGNISVHAALSYKRREMIWLAKLVTEYTKLYNMNNYLASYI